MKPSKINTSGQKVKMLTQRAHNLTHQIQIKELKMKALEKYQQRLRNELETFYFLITLFGIITFAGFALGIMLKADQGHLGNQLSSLKPDSN